MMKQTYGPFQVFVDGKGYLGEVSNYTPPNLTLDTEEYRGGGMIGTVDSAKGYSKMTSTISFVTVNPALLNTFGIKTSTKLPLVVRGSTTDTNGDISSYEYTMRGLVTSIEQGEVKNGEDVAITLNMTVHYFRQVVDGNKVHEIDVENIVHIVNGSNILEGIRSAMGLSKN